MWWVFLAERSRRNMIFKRQYFSVHIKGNLACFLLVYEACFHCVCCSDNPRLTLKQGYTSLSYNRNYSHTVLYHEDESNTVIAGGINHVLYFDVDSHQIVENLTLDAECGEGSCENAVTVIERLENYTFVCGTNGRQPRCWKLMEISTQQLLYTVMEPCCSFAGKLGNESMYGCMISGSQVDEGGPKQFLQNIWTSFLKARLVCGIPRESLYFNRLQDVFIQHADDWRDSQVYALFSSSWNSTAVCIYSLEELDNVFEHSSFKGSEAIPNPRPGTCVKQSNSIPIPNLQFIKDHPEMKNWIHPIKKETPFFTSNKNFTKIAVDRVRASDGNMHNVLLLATDNGVIFKILVNSSNAFIISETHLLNGSAPVHSMKLDSVKRKLFVGYPGQISVLDLQRCQDYNASCEECVLSRDPYCAWTAQGCTTQTRGGIQNIANGFTDVCRPKSGGRFTREVKQSSAAPLKILHHLHTGVPFYLSCPVDSNHATYKWEHDQKSIPCQKTQSECLLLIPAMSSGMYGDYKCTSHELDYTKTVREYNLFDENSRSAFNDAFKLRAQDWLMAAFVASVFYLRSL
ncbi:semaphorin-7A isoform X2 [Puntigrus tetrazona]|uniref:semaphorin-7A isoform X2 n=1 Tax=Puntigrus tetrazona TaxID=1606681 RepID=UPI001C89D69B|nr:semaphorin-7A isoform X2 [Puntigrus tetrazona]